MTYLTKFDEIWDQKGILTFYVFWKWRFWM